MTEGRKTDIPFFEVQKEEIHSLLFCSECEIVVVPYDIILQYLQY